MNKSKNQRIPRKKKKEIKKQLICDKQNHIVSSGAVLFRTPRKFSISKNEENVVNEDAALARDKVIAVSDGAGGGGVFADRWSQTLLENLPTEPITTLEEMNRWMDGFADNFYAECEELAKEKGGLFLDKFYDEGSFATLSAVWRVSEKECLWLQYGDSVAFCWNRDSGLLQSTISTLKEFDLPPFLINTIAEISGKALRTGRFHVEPNSVVFVASDAISHLLLMLYAVENQEQLHYKEMIEQAMSAQTKTANLVRAAIDEELSFRFVIENLLSNDLTESDKQEFLYYLERRGLLSHDDYSLAYAFCSQ